MVRRRPRLCENSCVQFARRKFFSFGQSENQKFWQRLFEEANRENCSTLSWLAHVFTRPGPEAAIRLFYSMTSLARARIDGGTFRPSASAVLRLTTSSNRVGCCTGKSAGLAPF